PAATGYSDEMAALVLDRMAADWRAERLRELLASELGDPAVLDGFAPTGRRRSRAYGPRLAFHVFAGNVPGVAVTSLIRSLLVKAPVLGKLASGQPVLPVLFAEALASVDPAIADALAVTYWTGGDPDTEWRVLQAADLVVVYGGDDAVASYRERIPPNHRLVVHGPRFSVGLIASDALRGELHGLAREVALAVATFDQHGCVSPHALWVEDPDGTVTPAFARALADALQHVETELPRGRISPVEASTIQQERGAAEMRGHAAGGVRVIAGEGTSWTVVLDAEPVFRPSCLNRFVHVHPVDDLDQALDFLAPAGHRLQSVALAGGRSRRARLAHRLAHAGATRVTTFPRLPWPDPDWHHDGRGPLVELLRWVDLEP
nr:hypothetical protein [Gemmatimonadota bacterium]NIS33346.1 hypothetical protein [Actinomycetota bacterium]NIQ56579.1 hypothetical protein [Gemmatimonadota bacterium]NIU68248.1 hypothetical protein [Actinomycetota bacterium]NIW30046.1 hypothetical protein [Actinomycetota bacterium]